MRVDSNNNNNNNDTVLLGNGEGGEEKKKVKKIVLNVDGKIAVRTRQRMYRKTSNKCTGVRRKVREKTTVRFFRHFFWFSPPLRRLQYNKKRLRGTAANGRPAFNASVELRSWKTRRDTIIVEPEQCENNTFGVRRVILTIPVIFIQRHLPRSFAFDENKKKKNEKTEKKEKKCTIIAEKKTSSARIRLPLEFRAGDRGVRDDGVKLCSTRMMITQTKNRKKKTG